MKSGGHKAQITFVDRTQHQIPHEEQDTLIQMAPAGTTQMIATEEGESEGHRLTLKVIRTKNPPLVCKVVGTNCVDALDKLQACLDRAKIQRSGEEK